MAVSQGKRDGFHRLKHLPKELELRLEASKPPLATTLLLIGAVSHWTAPHSPRRLWPCASRRRGRAVISAAIRVTESPLLWREWPWGSRGLAGC